MEYPSGNNKIKRHLGSTEDVNRLKSVGEVKCHRCRSGESFNGDEFLNVGTPRFLLTADVHARFAVGMVSKYWYSFAS